MTVIGSLKAEIDRLEKIKSANIEKFIINIRDELNQLWDECYYSEAQRLVYFITSPLSSHSLGLMSIIPAPHINGQFYLPLPSFPLGPNQHFEF